MITDPFIISTLALISGGLALVNSYLVISNFLYFRRKRAFLDYMNRKLSKGGDDDRNR